MSSESQLFPVQKSYFTIFSIDILNIFFCSMCYPCTTTSPLTFLPKVETCNSGINLYASSLNFGNDQRCSLHLQYSKNLFKLMTIFECRSNCFRLKIGFGQILKLDNIMHERTLYITCLYFVTLHLYYI